MDRQTLLDFILNYTTEIKIEVNGVVETYYLHDNADWNFDLLSTIFEDLVQ